MVRLEAWDPQQPTHMYREVALSTRRSIVRWRSLGRSPRNPAFAFGTAYAADSVCSYDGPSGVLADASGDRAKRVEETRVERGLNALKTRYNKYLPHYVAFMVTMEAIAIILHHGL